MKLMMILLMIWWSRSSIASWIGVKLSQQRSIVSKLMKVNCSSYIDQKKRSDLRLYVSQTTLKTLDELEYETFTSKIFYRCLANRGPVFPVLTQLFVPKSSRKPRYRIRCHQWLHSLQAAKISRYRHKWQISRCQYVNYNRDYFD